MIDCPPALNLLTLNALVAADSVLVPMQCEYYALEGLSALMDTVEQIRASVNPDLELEGILRTMFDPRNNLSNEVSGQLLLHFGDKVFRTVIPRNVRLAEAPSFGKAALFHDKDSRGALAYLALAGEMIRARGRARRRPGLRTTTKKPRAESPQPGRRARRIDKALAGFAAAGRGAGIMFGYGNQATLPGSGPRGPARLRHAGEPGSRRARGSARRQPPQPSPPGPPRLATKN